MRQAETTAQGRSRRTLNMDALTIDGSGENVTDRRDDLRRGAGHRTSESLSTYGDDRRASARSVVAPIES